MRYEFTLASSDGTFKVLQKPPVGWDNIKRSVLKDRIYFGLFKTISVELKFIYDGWDYLMDQLARYGWNMNVLLFIRKDNKHLLKGKVNTSDCNIDMDEKSFKIDIIQSDFIQKFTTRDELKLNILNDRSIDGQFIPPATLIDATLRNQIITFNSEFQLVNNEPEDNTLANLTRTLPLEPVSDENPQINLPFYVAPDPFTNDVPVGFENSIYYNEKTIDQEVSFSISYTIEENTVDLPGGVKGWSSILVERYNSSDVLQETLLSEDYTESGTYSKSSSFNVTFEQGDYLLAYVLNHSFVGGFGLCRFQSLNFEANEDSIFENTNCKYVLPHELFTNLISQMTGKNAFYSDIFGRTDLGYSEDGEAAYDARTNGKLIRQFDLSETELSFNFKEVFENYSKVYCLGLMIIDDVVHIDRMDTLFNRQKILDIGEVQKLTFKPAKDYLFNEVRVGYKDLEFEEVNGVDAVHGTSNFTNDLVAFKKDLNLVSTDVASGLAHELARRKPKTTHGTEDTEWDAKTFATRLTTEIDPLGIFGKSYTNERQEKIDYATGILSPETTINLYTVPSQNLHRWEKYLGISVYKSEKKYNYQTKAFNSKLELGAITPSGTIETKESGDIEVNGRYFVPEQANFDAPLARDVLMELLKDPLQIIQFKFKEVLYHHFLYEIDAETDSHEGSWNTLAINSFARKESPVNYDLLAIIKHGDGENDYIKHGDGENDYILYE